MQLLQLQLLEELKLLLQLLLLLVRVGGRDLLLLRLLLPLQLRVDGEG